MDVKRHHHACGRINFDTIIVAGGTDEFNDIIDSVEIFSLSLLEWRDGPNLPGRTSHSSSVQYKSSILIIGGKGGSGYHADSVYQFDESKFEWTVREENLLTPRSGHVTVPISCKPRNFLL